MKNRNRQSRRNFILKGSAAAAAPLILPGLGRAADEDKPSNKITMGFIGMGKQNGGLLNNFMGQGGVQVLAVCDVDTTRREAAKKKVDERYAKDDKWGGCAAYNEFEKIIDRKDIDAVCIATPDHWHAYITIAALRAGKDVYCEKPLTHNIHESIEVMKEVEKNKRVLQTGSMQRSMKEFRVACELVRNGAIGKLQTVDVSFGDPGRPCDLDTEQMEPGLDWDRWLGPGPTRGYSSVLSPRGLHKHFPHWRNYKEYGGGMVTDWGAHHLDIAQWGLGMDDSGPVEARPPEGWNEKSKRGASLAYSNGVVVTHGKGIGVHFHGTEGNVQVTRGRFAFHRGEEKIAQFLDKKKDRTSLGAQLFKCEKEYLADAKVQLYKSDHHLRDFLKAVRERKKPITSEIVGARSAIACHLMNQAYYNGEVIKWDPAKNELVGGTGKPEWLTRDYRGDWKV